jgi:hypothetical protein
MKLATMLFKAGWRVPVPEFIYTSRSFLKAKSTQLKNLQKI